jgi:crossover junction endodeoxyribonuclease RuvC
MRVLGIDPGTRHLGWGVLQRAGTRIEHVAHGVIDVDETGTLAERLVEIDDGLEAIVREQAPTIGAVEGLFFAKDAQSAAKLGHARGVVLLRLARSSMPIFEYAPAFVKRTVVGRGAADKRQVAMVMTAVLRLQDPPRSDAADALAIALTHLTVASFDAALHASGAPAVTNRAAPRSGGRPRTPRGR